jgi:hypothetical protein
MVGDLMDGVQSLGDLMATLGHRRTVDRIGPGDR